MKRAYVELAGDPFFGTGRCAATVEVSADGECELISFEGDLDSLDDVYEAARQQVRGAA